MALNARKRQKKTERKRAKQRARKKSMVRREPGDLSHQITQAERYPVLHCKAATTLQTNGIGCVLVSRRLPSRHVLFANFLVDIYCLGVKDAQVASMSYSEYEGILDSMPGEVVDVTPEAACKLVHGAIAYARDLGFPPHRDYALAGQILAGIDPSRCDQEFEFGDNGKPLFIAGPFDTPERCRRVIGILNDRCGPDGFDYVAHVGSLGSLSDGVLRLDGGEYLEFDDGFDDDDDDEE